MRRYRNIVLTGASSGIGRAMALELSGPDTTLLLIGRNSGRLNETAELAAENGSACETAAVDIRDAGALRDRLEDFDNRYPVDLIVANAGIARGLNPERALEPAPLSAEILDTNLIGALNTVQPLLPRLTERGHGQIALVSSLAAIRPSGDLPAYSASKAALVAWGVALRRRLRAQGVVISIVTPGFVVSPMSDHHSGPRPFRMETRQAAARIVSGLRRGRARISVPWQAAFMVRLENLLPPALADRIERRFAADILDPDISS